MRHDSMRRLCDLRYTPPVVGQDVSVRQNLTFPIGVERGDPFDLRFLDADRAAVGSFGNGREWD